MDSQNVRTVCLTIISVLVALGCIGGALALVFNDKPTCAIPMMMGLYLLEAVWMIWIARAK